jgi:hypothetical protein
MGDKAALKDFYYDKQVKRYYLQFMAIFAGLQCQIGKNDRSDGEEKFISVPIMNGNRDRVVGWTKGEHTQNKPLRLPIMSSNITNIELSPDRRKGVGTTRRETYLPTGGLFPDDIKSVHQYMPIPYKLYIDLSIWASNQEQRFQITEQILPLFDPTLQIQSTDAQFDWKKLTTVELIGVGLEDNYPIGTEKRMLITTLNFEVPIWIGVPDEYKSNFVKDVLVRIGTIDSSSNTNEEIIADLDAQGIPYESWFEGDTIEGVGGEE